MEEKPKPRSVILLEVALVFGALSGLIGGIYGIAVTAGKGGPSERVVIPTLIAAPIVGAVFVVAVWLLMPRPKARIMDWVAQLLADIVGAALLCGVAFYVFARMMKS
jgi:hypothetical protein